MPEEPCPSTPADWDCFKATPEEIKAYGGEIHPLISVTPHPGVGQAVLVYSYEIDGSIHRLTRPSPSFEAMTAPPEVLEALGMSARPSPDDVGYDVWVARYGKTTGSSWVEPPPYLVTGITPLHDPRPLRIRRRRDDETADSLHVPSSKQAHRNSRTEAGACPVTQQTGQGSAGSAPTPVMISVAVTSDADRSASCPAQHPDDSSGA